MCQLRCLGSGQPRWYCVIHPASRLGLPGIVFAQLANPIFHLKRGLWHNLLMVYLLLVGLRLSLYHKPPYSFKEQALPCHFLLNEVNNETGES